MVTRFPTMQQRMFDNREAVEAVEKILRKILKDMHAQITLGFRPRLYLVLCSHEFT